MINLVTTKKYIFKPWYDRFKISEVNIKSIPIHSTWLELFHNLIDEGLTKNIEKLLQRCVDKKLNIFPYPNLVFHAFNLTPLDQVRVVVLGQDPYFNYEQHNDHMVPLAMGLSFSVPTGIKVPSSLKNIYKNLVRFKHMDKAPTNGNLECWAYQGCLMFNTSLTVQHKHPNSHTKYWSKFTDRVIEFLSDNCGHLVFVLWGGPALNKLGLIDRDKHKVVASSHPSGLSCSRGLRGYSCFNDQDHFKIINDHLKSFNYPPIDWDLSE